MSDRSMRPAALWSLFLVAWLIRLAACGLETGFGAPESDLWSRARHVVAGQGPVGWVRGVDPCSADHYDVIWQPSAIYRRPLPWLCLIPFAALPASWHWTAYLFTTALSAATVVLVARLTARIAGADAGLAAGALTASFPYLVINTFKPYDTVFVSFGTVALIDALWSWRATGRCTAMLLAGLSAGGLLLSRFSTPALVGLMGLWLLGATPGSWRQKLAGAASFAAIAGACCLPWLAYVHSQSGRWSLGPGVGKGLYWAYNRHTLEEYPWVTIDVPVLEAWRDLPVEFRERVARGELVDFEANEPLERRAKAYIADHWKEVLAFLPVKLVSPWLPFSPWTDHGDAQPERVIVHGVTSYGALLLAGIGFWMLRRDRATVALLALPWFAMEFSAAFMWAHSRQRSEFDALLFIPAGVGLIWLWTWIRETSPGPKIGRLQPVPCPVATRRS